MSLSKAQKCLTCSPASLLGLFELDRDSFRLKKTCEFITSKMYLLLKKQWRFGCSFPLAKCLGILRIFSAHSSSNFPLIWHFTPSRFSDSLFSGLLQCVVHVVGSVSSLPVPNSCHSWADDLAVYIFSDWIICSSGEQEETWY